MTEQETIKLLSIARSVWPSMMIERETIRAWQAALADLSADAAQVAMMRHIRLSPFEPHPADVRRNVVEMIYADAMPWEDAWRELTETARTYGLAIYDDQRGYIAPYVIGPTDADGRPIDHPDTRSYPGRSAWSGWSSDAVAGAVDAIGYRTFLLTDARDLNTMRAQFRDIYNATSARRAVDLQAGNAILPRVAAETALRRDEGPQAIGNTLAAIKAGMGRHAT